jgi:hypothetical protein
MRAELKQNGQDKMKHRPNAPFNLNPSRRGAPLLLALTVMLLSACASNQPARPAVVERAEARWEAVVTGDLESAYEYYSPGFRSANSLIDFGVSIRTRKVKWTSAEYLDHSCEANRCTVNFNIGFMVMNPVPGASVFNGKENVKDTWVRTSGQWWYLPNN